MAKIKQSKLKKSKVEEAIKKDDIDNVVVIPPVRMSDDPTPKAVSNIYQ